jgi:hypothetical protein
MDVLYQELDHGSMPAEAPAAAASAPLAPAPTADLYGGRSQQVDVSGIEPFRVPNVADRHAHGPTADAGR